MRFKSTAVLVALVAVLAVSAVASASASAALNLQWEVCEKGGENKGEEEWSNHKCNAGKGTGEWSFKKLEAGKSYNVDSSGGQQFLISHIGGIGIEIKCNEVKTSGTIEGGKPGKGKDEMVYHGCEILGASECGLSAKSPGKEAGIISLTVKSVLVEISPGVEGESFEASTGRTLGELEFGKKENKSTHKYEEKCGSFFPLAAQKVDGAVVGKAAIPTGRNLCEGLEFTNPGQRGSGLEMGTEPLTYVGEVTSELENKWAFRCS
jgi:hypothetical protein